jgi:hypothetical protein
MKTYKELEDTYLKALCLIIHHSESVILFEDTSYFPKELIETANLLVKKFEGITKDSVESLRRIASGEATVEDYVKVADDKYYFNEQLSILIYLEMHESTLNFIDNQDEVEVVEEN